MTKRTLEPHDKEEAGRVAWDMMDKILDLTAYLEHDNDLSEQEQRELSAHVTKLNEFATGALSALGQMSG
jgi:hypothetical protein